MGVCCCCTNQILWENMCVDLEDPFLVVSKKLRMFQSVLETDLQKKLERNRRKIYIITHVRVKTYRVMRIFPRISRVQIDLCLPRV